MYPSYSKNKPKAHRYLVGDFKHVILVNIPTHRYIQGVQLDIVLGTTKAVVRSPRPGKLPPDTNPKTGKIYPVA